MATKIKRDFVFQAGVHFDSKFIMNLFTVNLSLYVETEDMTEQTVAMERIKYYIYECLEGSVFIHSEEYDAIDRYCAAGIKVCTLPIEPYEQIIAILLLTKLNMLVEGKLDVVEVEITSKLSDGVTIVYDIEQPMGPFEENGWWNNKKIVINDLTVTKDGDKVVKLISRHQTTWEDIGLSWETKEPSTTSATIVSLRDDSEA